MTPFSKNLLSVAVLAGVVALTGCGGDNAGSKPADNAQTATKKPAGEPNPDKKHINLGMSSEPESLDPHKASDSLSFDIQRQMFVGLLSVDENGKPAPSVAESWENKDFKVWTFKLKKDIKWSNGDPMTANDFVFGMRRLTDPANGSPYGGFLADAKVANAKEIGEGKAKLDTLGVKALDDYTLEITLSEPVPYFADLMSFSATFPVHQKTVETHGAKWLDPANIVVSGAYTLKEAVANSHIALVRNDKYYKNAETKLDSATYWLTQGANAVNRFKAGDLDINAGIPFDLFQSLKQELGDQVQVAPAMCTSYYEMNTKQAPFNDIKVRQAMSLILDRSIIPEKVLRRGEKPTYQFTPSSINGAPSVKPTWANDDMAKRIETAKGLLKEAGYDESKPLKFELLYTTNETAKRINSAIAQEFKKITGGVVDTTINNQEWKVSLQSRREGKYQMASGAWCADYNEPSTFLNTFRTGNGNNSSFYSNPEYDKTLDATMASGVTDEQRKELYAKAEQIMMNDTPAIFTFESVAPLLIKSDVQGFPITDPTQNYQISKLYFSK